MCPGGCGPPARPPSLPLPLALSCLTSVLPPPLPARRWSVSSKAGRGARPLGAYRTSFELSECSWNK